MGGDAKMCLLKVFHNSCTSVWVRKAFTAFVQVSWKGVYNICKSAFCKAVTTFVQVLSARLLQHLYRCFVKGVYKSLKLASAVKRIFCNCWVILA
jgi:hypothetical protein